MKLNLTTNIRRKQSFLRDSQLRNFIRSFFHDVITRYLAIVTNVLFPKIGRIVSVSSLSICCRSQMLERKSVVTFHLFDSHHSWNHYVPTQQFFHVIEILFPSSCNKQQSGQKHVIGYRYSTTGSWSVIAGRQWARQIQVPTTV